LVGIAAVALTATAAMAMPLREEKSTKK